MGASCMNLNPDREDASLMKAYFASCEFYSTGGANSSAIQCQSSAEFDYCLIKWQEVALSMSIRMVAH